MKRGITGRYEKTSVGGETVKAFIPTPLPPVPPLEFNEQRQLLQERATVALGRLDSITVLLPDPNIFLYAYVRREAVLSSQIEGTQSSLAQLLLFELDHAPGVPLDDVIEVSNYVAALNHGLIRLQEDFPFSNRLVSMTPHTEMVSWRKDLSNSVQQENTLSQILKLKQI